METRNIKLLALLVAFLLGIVMLFLSYFEKGLIALIYQLVSIILLSVSVIMIYLCFMMDTKDNIKIVSVSKEKLKKEEPAIIEAPKLIIEKDENAEFFKKNIISIDLEENDDNLTQDEKKVVDALRQKQGSMQQKEVTDKVFSKNKVKSHRVIASLIKKDYVIKRNEGKTNKIFLKR